MAHNITYIVAALKIIIYDNIVCFCLKTSEIYVKLNIIKFLYEFSAYVV